MALTSLAQKKRGTLFWISCLVWLGAAVISVRANAAGYFLPDLGAKSLGRGTAFVVRADDGSAFYYNPAGLTKNKEGVDTYFTSTVGVIDLTFQRKGAAGVERYDPEHPENWDPEEKQYIFLTEQMMDYGVKVGNPSFDYRECTELGPECATEFEKVSPKTPVSLSGIGIIASWGKAFDVEGLTLAAGMFTPTSAGAQDYDPDGPQRYTVVEATAFALSYGLGLSYRFNRYLQLGGVFLVNVVWGSQKQRGRSSASYDTWTYNEEWEFDSTFWVEFSDPFIPGGIIGVLSNPTDWLELGASMRLPYKMKAEGKTDFTPYPESMEETVPGHDSLVIHQNFPMVVSTGVRFIHPRFDIEVDFVWEQWSVLQTREVDLDWWVDNDGPTNGWDEAQGNTVNKVADTSQPKFLRDTYSVRVGSDIALVPETFTVRVGGLWESSHYPENNMTFALDNPFGEKYGISCGLTFSVSEAIAMTVGYMHLFQKTVEVTKGIVQQNTAIRFDPQEEGFEEDDRGPFSGGNVVNNGVYEVGFDLFSMSIEGHF